MRDGRGRIIYVGKAASLRKRVQSYFRKATLRSAAPKLRGLIKSIHDLDWVVVRSEAEAVLTEGRLIKDYRPRYNVSFKDDKRFLLLGIKPSSVFPRFRLCRIAREDGSVYFGPYASAGAARATLDFTEKRFGLRKCTPRMPDEGTYRHCLNDIIRYCAAPCMGKIDRDGYHERVAEAMAFLRGERPQYLKEVRQKMEALSDKRQFERAAAVRDTLLHLHETVKRRTRMASTPDMRKEEARTGIRELKHVLGLRAEPRVIEGYDVSNISGTLAVASMVCAVDGVPRRNRYRRFRIKTVEGSDDPRMMAEVIRRRFADVGEGDALPDLVLLDGGITQVRAARVELQRLGLPQVATAGLAKRFEEIYAGTPLAPIRLSRDAAALKILQRLRDEAHRFALAYHRRLRTQRIRESVLDDIPGIGPRKKQRLLEHFGSVKRLLQADEAAISEAPGIGPALARAILKALS